MKKKSDKMPMMKMTYDAPKSVTIKKADNGFMVCCYTDKGEKSMIAKNEKEAVKHAKMLLGDKKGK